SVLCGAGANNGRWRECQSACQNGAATPPTLPRVGSLENVTQVAVAKGAYDKGQSKAAICHVSGVTIGGLGVFIRRPVSPARAFPAGVPSAVVLRTVFPHPESMASEPGRRSRPALRASPQVRGLATSAALIGPPSQVVQVDDGPVIADAEPLECCRV